MDTKSIEATALSIRSLSMGAIQKANSGHPGLPLGAAEVAAVLYGQVMKHNPADSKWKCPKCGAENSGKFCAECGSPKPAGEWTCECGQSGNKGKFCSNCGKPRP